VVVTIKEDVPIESSTDIAVKDGTAGAGINRLVDPSTIGSTEFIEAASDTNQSTAGCENKKRKQFASSSLNVEDGSCNNLQPCGNIESCNEDKKEIVEKSSMAEISAVVEVAATIPKETHVMQQSNAKKQKIEYGLDSLMKFDDSFDKTENSMKSEFNEDINDSFDISSTHDTLEYPKQTSSSLIGDEQKMPFARRPKVSIGSTDNGGCSSSSDEDSEMDVMIAKGSTMWSTNKKSEEEEEDSHLDDNNDDSDIVCLGTSSESQQLDEIVYSTEREEDAENNTNSYLPEEPNSSNHEDLNNSSLPEQLNSPKKDVCYICGTDLTRIKSGLKGRVAHMKRCSLKYGETLGARRTMNNDGDDADFVEMSTIKEATARSPHEGPVTNPYKQQWHGDASSELALNKTQKETQQKSQWKELFKKPVRSLTNVLMSGARQASKVKAITTNSASITSKSGRQPYRRGQWSSNNSKRTGTCPSFKRITGTDFIWKVRVSIVLSCEYLCLIYSLGDLTTSFGLHFALFNCLCKSHVLMQVSIIIHFINRDNAHLPVMGSNMRASRCRGITF